MHQFNSLKFLLFLFLTILFSACIDFDKGQVENLSDGEVLKIGHGGSGFKRWLPFQALPANSLGSIKKALAEEGVDGIEVDLQMTRDGKFVLYHDNELSSLTDLDGCISERSFNEVKGLSYQLEWPFNWFQNERILSLEELLTYFLTLEKFPYLHLDMRTYSNCNQLAANLKYEQAFLPTLHQTLSRYSIPKEKLLLISVTKESILIARNLNSPYHLSLEVISDFEADLAWAIEHKVDYLTVKPRLLSAEKVKKAHQAGIQIITFGAKSKSGNKKLLELNPDIVQTDNLSALIELLN
ncbi:MAG: glycerophosphodiester phosphodiesterase family protein [Vicingaceae bacterium]